MPLTFSYAQEYRTVHSPFTLSPGKKNETFKIGSRFSYDYKVSSKGISGKVLLSKIDSKKWKIGTSEEVQSIIIENIILRIVKRGLFNRTNFFQTQITYEYNTDTSIPLIEETGLIESKNNIWIHPPRSYFFRILQLAPFPYLKFSSDKNDSEWTDEIVIGNHWSDQQWATWEGDLILKLEYQIKGKDEIKTAFGKLEVYRVHAKSSSDIGISSLDFIFNRKYGVIQMNYNILDKYEIQFDLINTN